MCISPSVVDLVENATISYDAPDHKNHKMFPYGFKNYQGRVGIDETIFKYIVKVGKARNNMIFYDICLEVDGKVPRAKRTSLIKTSTSNNSIPDSTEKVNTSEEKIQFSRKAEDVNAKNTVTMSRGDFIHRRWIYSANGGFN